MTSKSWLGCAQIVLKNKPFFTAILQSLLIIFYSSSYSFFSCLKHHLKLIHDIKLFMDVITILLLTRALNGWPSHRYTCTFFKQRWKMFIFYVSLSELFFFFFVCLCMYVHCICSYKEELQFDMISNNIFIAKMLLKGLMHQEHARTNWFSRCTLGKKRRF